MSIVIFCTTCAGDPKLCTCGKLFSPQLVDLNAVEVVELSIRDDAGVIWVNVDGVCRLRINNPKRIIIDDKIAGTEIDYRPDRDPQRPMINCLTKGF